MLAAHDEITQEAAHIAAATCRWLQKVAEFDKDNTWAGTGARSAPHWLSWSCGMDPTSARDALRVAARLEELPLITKKFSKGELSYWQVRQISRIATPETEEYLLYLAMNSTAAQLTRIVSLYKSALEAYALELANTRNEKRFLDYWFDADGFLVLKGRLCPEDGALVRDVLNKIAADLGKGRLAKQPEHLAEFGPGDVYATVGANRADALVALAHGASAPTAEVVLHVSKDSLCGLEDGPSIPTETARRLACDASIVSVHEENNKPVIVGRRTRVIPIGTRRAIHIRDLGCRFPGCDGYRKVQAHHIKHWGRGGDHELDNLIELCTFHHRLVHEGGYTVEGDPSETLQFRRLRGDLVELVRPKATTAEAIAEENRNQGLNIDPNTSISGWDGGRALWGEIISGIAQEDSRWNDRKTPDPDP